MYEPVAQNPSAGHEGACASLKEGKASPVDCRFFCFSTKGMGGGLLGGKGAKGGGPWWVNRVKNEVANRFLGIWPGKVLDKK